MATLLTAGSEVISDERARSPDRCTGQHPVSGPAVPKPAYLSAQGGRTTLLSHLSLLKFNANARQLEAI